MLSKMWLENKKEQNVVFATTVRLRADVDQMLQTIIDHYPKITQTQVINDALYQSLLGVYAEINTDNHQAQTEFKE